MRVWKYSVGVPRRGEVPLLWTGHCYPKNEPEELQVSSLSSGCSHTRSRQGEALRSGLAEEWAGGCVACVLEGQFTFMNRPVGWTVRMTKWSEGYGKVLGNRREFNNIAGIKAVKGKTFSLPQFWSQPFILVPFSDESI